MIGDAVLADMTSQRQMLQRRRPGASYLMSSGLEQTMEVREIGMKNVTALQ